MKSSSPKIAQVCFGMFLICWMTHVQAQCENPPGQFDANTQLQKELSAIFSKLNLLQLSVSGPISSPVKDNHEKIIVPGKRVGPYDLDRSFSSISSLLRLQKPVRKMDEKYRFVLLLGYVPERDFSVSQDNQLTFAFSTDTRLLKEIFVMDSTYKTSSGLSIGTSILTVKNFFDVIHRKGGDQKEYYIGKGITFITGKDQKVQTMVITK